VSALAIDNR